MSIQTLFQQVIGKKPNERKSIIAFGLKEPNVAVLKSLRKTKNIARIILVGPHAINGVKDFDKDITNNPERRLAELLASGKVEGIVRGTIDDFKTLDAYASMIGKTKAEKMRVLTLLEDAFGRQFLLSDVSNPSGWTIADKKKSCEALISFLKNELGVKPRLGFMTGIRHETYQRRKNKSNGIQRMLNKTYEDVEVLVNYFRKKGVAAKNYTIEIETAIQEGSNIIVPPNGMVGNQIFRTLTLIGGGKILAGSRIGLPSPYEDNSRSETDFETHIRWLVAWINNRK
jgi:predicted methyltransferase MtxX (methanogen marker protein 4)